LQTYSESLKNLDVLGLDIFAALQNPLMRKQTSPQFHAVVGCVKVPRDSRNSSGEPQIERVLKPCAPTARPPDVLGARAIDINFQRIAGRTSFQILMSKKQRPRAGGARLRTARFVLFLCRYVGFVGHRGRVARAIFMSIDSVKELFSCDLQSVRRAFLKS